MKKITLCTLMAVFLATTPAFAHCGQCGTGEKGSHSKSSSADWVEKKVKSMTESLGLSDKQAKKLKAALKRKKAAKQAARDTYKKKLKSILTSEQYEKYQAMRGEKGSHKHEKGSHKEYKGSH